MHLIPQININSNKNQRYEPNIFRYLSLHIEQLDLYLESILFSNSKRFYKQKLTDHEDTIKLMNPKYKQ